MKNKIDKVLKFKFSLEQRISIYEKLKSYTEEEFPVYDSLLKFKTRYEKKRDFKAKIIGVWLEKMKMGDSFSKAISGWVPEAELNLISAGETGRGIEVGLGEAIKFARAAQEIKSAIVGGITYPAILTLVVLGFVALFSLQMAPTYMQNLPIERWPTLGQNLYFVSSFIVNNWMYLILGLVLSSVAIGSTIGKWTGHVRQVFDRVPPWSVYKVYQASAFLISLASLMQSGTPLNDSLQKIARSSSPWLAWHINIMIKNMKKGGKNFGMHLNVGLLDDETAGDVIDYSELGKFEIAIYSIGEKNLKTSIKQINERMGIIKNLLIVMVGVTVGVIYYTSIELNTAIAEAATTRTH